MSARPLLRAAQVALLACFAPSAAFAHSFSTPYILPIPFWIYLYGCAGTLVVTFAVLGFFASEPVAAGGAQAASRLVADRSSPRLSPWFVSLLRVGAVLCLLLTIVAGFIGNDDPGRNIGMTLFWVLFLLWLAYLTVFVGNVYALINPWLALIEWLERAGLDLSRSRLRYPERLGQWPALLFYIALIWMELFFEQKPATLSNALLLYSALTLVGAVLFGKAVWFARADLFSHYFAVISKLAPVEYVGSRAEQGVRVRLRMPFAALANERPEHIALVLFVLFMLSSTAYDAIHDSQMWTALFWSNAMRYLQPLWGTDLGKAQRMLMGSFLVYRKVGLLLSPFVYFAFYFVALLLAKLLARSAIAARSLALSFCYSLIPIAVAYNFSHYYTFAVDQFRALPWLLTDPFGFDWNLLGLDIPQNTGLQMAIVWHTQVIVILIGHVAGVVASHQVATRVFATRRQVLASQVPLLVLMVGYTMMGLWILTLPLG